MFAYETEAFTTEVDAETKAFNVETEAKIKTFSLEAEARLRRLKFQPRRDRAVALLRLEMASRPRRQDRGHIPGKGGWRFQKNSLIGLTQDKMTIFVHIMIKFGKMWV